MDDAVQTVMEQCELWTERNDERITIMEKSSWSLPNKFFENNPLRTNLTAGHLSYFRMRTAFDTDLDERLTDYVYSSFVDERKHELLDEREAIEAITDPSDIIRFMRKEIDISNRNLLCKKAVNMGGDLPDLIIDKLRTNGIDVFIECASLILSHTDKSYIDCVANEFRQFRNGYARAQATVLLAYRNRIDALKSMYDEYIAFRNGDHEGHELSQTVLFSMYVVTGNMDGLDADFSDYFDDVLGEGV